MKRILSKLLILPILFSLSGCVYMIVGGIGAVGGYVVSPDTVEGIIDYDTLSVWDAAVEISSIMGVITEQYEDGGVIVAKINGAKTTITISSLNDETTKLNIKARKFYTPKISIAQDVYLKIVDSLT